MKSNSEIVRGIIVAVVMVAAVGYYVFWTIRKAEDPGRRLFKWVLTALILSFMVFKVAPMVGAGGMEAAFTGVPLTAFCGLALAIIWRYDLAALIARPFSNLYDGGSIPPEPKPVYSMAIAKQKKGHYAEAIADIREQLARFPNDFEGQLLLAQIQAEDLRDLPGAELTIQRFCAQPGHAPRNLVFALYSLADWYLQFGPDREAAQRALEKVIELLPDSEYALGAAQRIAHLGTSEMLLSPHDRKPIPLPEGVKNVGLVTGKSGAPAAPAEADPKAEAVQLVGHLEQHPLDTEARERLAVIYADHYGRLDLASDQLEQMISQPNQPGRLATRWLNLLADLQVRGGADYDTVKATLERIIEREPNVASAETARKRLGLLRLEFKAREKNADVKMGTYEQKLGLKEGWGPRRNPGA